MEGNQLQSLQVYPNILERHFDPIASSTLDCITQSQVTAFIIKRTNAKLNISSINRELEVLRRMLRLAVEWGLLERPGIRVQILPGRKSTR
jgi:hypothetical protein